MNATKIEYLHFTWSPNVGCSGQDCAVYAHCFAKKFKKRNLLKCPSCYEFKPHNHFERLDQPLTTQMPRRIGVDFSADFWDKGFTMNDRTPVFNVVRQAPWHRFINLTKQPQNIPSDFVFPKNWVQGVSVNRKEELWRIEDLNLKRATMKMISFEPLYEDIADVLDWQNITTIDWFIIGAQTHPLIRPKDVWIKNLVDFAGAVDIPVFIKNNVTGWNFKEYPEELLVGGK
jgi:protein gp37